MLPDSPPSLYQRRVKAISKRDNQNEAQDTSDVGRPNPFDLLDSPGIAQAVWTVSAQDVSPVSILTMDTARDATTIRPRGQDSASLPPSIRGADHSTSNFVARDDLSSYDTASLELTPNPERFVSQTEFQNFLLRSLRESVMEGRKFSISRDKLEAWINWTMANPQ